RGFKREVLEKLPLNSCDEDFVFDNEMLALVKYYGFTIGELSCPTKYFPKGLGSPIGKMIDFWNCSFVVIS
ncbi:MAG: hypothetical protein IJS09_09755, partial [Treponema sp.]|nr:hypothetical protein [Treponema sp.]